MIVNYVIDSADGIEQVEIIQPNINFSRKIFTDIKNHALKEAKKDHGDLVI